MRRILLGLAVASGCVLLAAGAGATSNLNLSKSNLYRLTYHASLATEAQARAMLAELDRLGPMSEARLKHWLATNFKRLGIAAELVKKVVIVPAGQAVPETVVIVLADPADEATARATSVKSGKSSSSD